MWQEVCARLNEEFGRRRSVAQCYVQLRAKDKRAAALATGRAAKAEAEAPVAQVDALESSRSASATSLFSLPVHSDALTAFGGNGSLDTDRDDGDNFDPAPEAVGRVDSDGGGLLSYGLPTQVVAERLQKQQWAPLDSKPALRP